MGFTQATQSGKSPHLGDDSVRITAQQRRDIIHDFLADAIVTQRAVAEGERTDRKATESAAPRGFFTTADLRVSNAAAVQQWIASNLAAYSVDNRDFGAVSA